MQQRSAVFAISNPLPTFIQTNRALADSVYTTLLELYLGELGSCKKEDRAKKEERALQLLQRPEVSLLNCLSVSWYMCIYVVT